MGAYSQEVKKLRAVMTASGADTAVCHKATFRVTTPEGQVRPQGTGVVSRLPVQPAGTSHCSTVRSSDGGRLVSHTSVIREVPHAVEQEQQSKTETRDGSTRNACRGAVIEAVALEKCNQVPHIEPMEVASRRTTEPDEKADHTEQCGEAAAPHTSRSMQAGSTCKSQSTHCEEYRHQQHEGPLQEQQEQQEQPVLETGQQGQQEQAVSWEDENRKPGQCPTCIIA